LDSHFTENKIHNQKRSAFGANMANIQSILEQMTLEEKAALCTGASFWTTTPVKRLGVPEMMVTDGPHGVRRVPDVMEILTESLPATCFPTASCLASTWNVDLAGEMGQALGDECVALNVDVILGPGANMKRTPLCGRNFEYFSEDPFLAGELAASLINGIQRKGVGTSLKHFAANSQEFHRFSVSAEIDERTLREIYLPAFETAVKKAKPWTVMCAYNKLNGTLCSENHELLGNILKKEWGFEGLVVSDWGAVHDRVASLKGGVDLEMPGPKEARVKNVVEAVRAGELDEAVLNEAVRRILNIVFKAAQTPKGGKFDIDAHHTLARQISAEGIVLLKNNGVLPLMGARRIAVIGRAACEPYYQGGGSSHINATRVDIPFDELRKLAGSAELIYSEGYPADTSFHSALIDEAVAAAGASDVALLYICLPAGKESEGYDRADLDLTPQQVALIKAVYAVQPQTVVILNNGAPVVMSEWIDSTAAVVEAWMMGQAGGGAIADVLMGRVNPSGRLAETFPLKLTDTPATINYPGEVDKMRYGEGIFIGYRYYEAKQMPVQFPFGHGQSYTTFEYSQSRVSASTFKDVDGLTVSVNVTNTGKVAGKEVIQVYVHDHKSALVRPAKELKGFAKVELQPGETRTVTIPLDFRAFAYYHPGYQQWITEDGEFDILIGASSADIRAIQTVMLQSSLKLPTLLNKLSTVHDWLEDPKGRAVIGPAIQEHLAKTMKQFGLGENGAQALGMQDLVLDMPFLSLLEFQEDSLPIPPAKIVDGLLAQLRAAND
jgi:beta-glucosidase